MKPVTLTTTTTEVLDFATALGIRDGIAGSRERNRTLANLLALAAGATSEKSVRFFTRGINAGYDAGYARGRALRQAEQDLESASSIA